MTHRLLWQTASISLWYSIIMDTRTLLYSRLDALAKKLHGPIDDRSRDEAIQLSKSILSRELDQDLLLDVCQYWRDSAVDASDIQKLANILAILIDPEVEPDEPPPSSVYSDLAEILNEHAETMDLDQLTDIMNAILAKGGI